MKHVPTLLYSAAMIILLAACNLPGGVPTLSESPAPGDPEEEITLTAELLATSESLETAEIDSTEPTTEPQIPPIEPPGELEAATQHIVPGESFDVQYIHMIDPEHGWAIGGSERRSDSVLRTEDGGSSWQEVSPPQEFNNEVPLMAVGNFLDANTGWALYFPVGDSQPGKLQALRVWQTDDGGKFWRASAPSQVEFIGASFAPASIQFADREHGWILARYGGSGMHRYPVYLLSSRDGGGSWQILEDPYEGLYLQSCPKSGMDWHPDGIGVVTISYCPFDSAEIHISLNAGQSWESIRLPLPENEAERLGSTSCEAHSPIVFAEDDIVVASECPIWSDEPQSIHLLYTSTDQGASWDIHEYPGGALQYVGGDVIMALGREIFHSDDRGRTWSSVKQVSWDGQFSFVDPLHGWAVARDDDEIALVRTVDGGASWQLIEPQLSP